MTGTSLSVQRQGPCRSSTVPARFHFPAVMSWANPFYLPYAGLVFYILTFRVYILFICSGACQIWKALLISCNCCLLWIETSNNQSTTTSFPLPLSLTHRCTDTFWVFLLMLQWMNEMTHPCYSSNVPACNSFDFVAGAVVEAWYFKTKMGLHALSGTDKTFCFWDSELQMDLQNSNTVQRRRVYIN